MKKNTLVLLISVLFLTSCGGVKKTENAISTGNYDQAFDNAVQRLNKDKSKNAKQIPLLKDAYDKANQRDLNEIALLKKNKTSENLKRIHKKYLQLDVRQDEVVLLKPLVYEGKEYDFTIRDYTNDIAKAKKDYSDDLYSKASPLLYGSKENARKAFTILEEIQVINPDYRSDLNTQIIAAKKRGMDNVLVKLYNKVSNQLQDSVSQVVLSDFTEINTGNFTNKWVNFDSNRDLNLVYDYQLGIYLDKITSQPEKTHTQKVNQEKEVQVGWNYKLDDKGNVMKDANGNDIKTPKMGKITATVTLYQQVKSLDISGKTELKNLKTNAVLNSAPISGLAKLENIYATYEGDPKAIEQKYYEALQKKKAQFPDDSAFKKFALQTFKQKVEQAMSQQQF